MDQSCLKKIILYVKHKSSRVWSPIFSVSKSTSLVCREIPNSWHLKVRFISSPRTGLEHMLVALGQLVLSVVIITINVLLVLLYLLKELVMTVIFSRSY